MFKFVSAAVVAVSLFPAAAGAQSFSRVLAATDASLAGAFSSALKAPVTIKVSAPAAEKAAATGSEYAPIARAGVYIYEYSSNKFSGKRLLRFEYGPYSERDGLVTVTISFDDRTSPWTGTFQMQNGPDGVTAGGSTWGMARLEMPNPVVYNYKWDEGNVQNRIAAVNTTATTPAGSFRNCVRILSRIDGGNTGTINRYYAPGVGLVMEQLISRDKQETITLLHYQLK